MFSHPPGRKPFRAILNAFFILPRGRSMYSTVGAGGRIPGRLSEKPHLCLTIGRRQLNADSDGADALIP